MLEVVSLLQEHADHAAAPRTIGCPDCAGRLEVMDWRAVVSVDSDQTWSNHYYTGLNQRMKGKS